MNQEQPTSSLQPCDFSALLGDHVLDAVDFDNEQVKTWDESFENAQVMRFRLDGKVYVAVEDPDDGYRSSLDTFCVGDVAMKNVFEPVQVIGKHRLSVGDYPKGDICYSEADVLELIDIHTGKVVLEVGTEGVDDYYPCFVASFYPEAMILNAQPVN